MDKDEELEKPQITHEEALAFAQLTDDEKRTEKKLRILLDTLILPLIVIIYLMVGLPFDFLCCACAGLGISADGVCRTILIGNMVALYRRFSFSLTIVQE